LTGAVNRMESLSVNSIIIAYTAAEIDAEIARLKKELKNPYSDASADGKRGVRSVESIHSDLEMFIQAKAAKMGLSGGIVSVQANWGGR